MGDTVGGGAKVVTAVLALIICTGTANAFVASLTQLGYSLSRDGASPKIFLKAACNYSNSKTDGIVCYLFFGSRCVSDKSFVTNV